ncbi:sugar phosphate isomerase/epimerase [Paenibacillus sp. HB172176]|uniref:sugar phosphate isomerase/epimerase family protein n=1 Tax=Paenibacillus sp. HB172176 TaxID=2493690 RepID=UPI00143A57C9|nr:sugar phosphate isomerase/epimerase [Paenibacillus sp. HB172176]
MQLGISTYTFTWAIGVPGYAAPQTPLTLEGLLAIASAHHVSLVQIADNIPLHAQSDSQLNRLKELADDSRIDLEVGTRGTAPEHLLRYLAIAKQLGAKLVRSLITMPDLAAARLQLAEALPHFENAGVCLAIENHGLHRSSDLAALLCDLRSPMLGCCLDTVNSFGALDDPQRVFEHLMPYVRNLHIKDFTIERVSHAMGFEILGTPAGYGKLNIPDLLRRATTLPERPTAILELWTPYTKSIGDTIRLERKWFEQSLAYLNTLNFE